MYKEAAKILQGTDLTKTGALYSVDWDLVPEEKRNRIFDAEDLEGCLVDIFFVEENDLWGESKYVETDEFERDMVLEELIKDAGHYLVMAYGCRWDGGSGYKFAGTRSEALSRSYEACITPVKASAGGKTLICRESSHDVPMGAQTSIIALTEKEYEKLKDADWETVLEFAGRCEKCA